MSRGQIKLFNNLFDDPASQEQDTLKRKGRCPVLNSERNSLIVDRFHYYGTFTNTRFEVVLSTLCAEFFLTERSITEILDKNYERLVSLKGQSLDKKYFKQKWPFFNWDVA